MPRPSPLLFVMTAFLLLTSLSVLVVAPSNMPESVVNTGEDGLSMLYSEYNAAIILRYSELERLDPKNTILVLTSASSLDSNGLKYVADYLAKGGSVVMWVDNTAEGFLSPLNLTITVYNGTLLDEVSKHGTRFEPVVFSRPLNVSVVLEKPRPIESWGPGGECILYSSPFSYIDLNGNGFYDPGEPMDSFCVGVAFRYLNGTVFIIPSSNIFVNNLFSLNKDFLDEIRGGREVVIDQTAQSRDLLEHLRLAASTRGYNSFILVFLLGTLLAGGVLVVRQKF
ncbi:hypothetical protein [Thermogladius sp.]|uniref:hypothetical protein n=1 Tax=Thermogladius sp. TaxID=2023064 RepID=UPI003D0FE843